MPSNTTILTAVLGSAVCPGIYLVFIQFLFTFFTVDNNKRCQIRKVPNFLPAFDGLPSDGFLGHSEHSYPPSRRNFFIDHPIFPSFRNQKPVHSPQAHHCRATAATSTPNFLSISQPRTASCGHSGRLGLMLLRTTISHHIMTDLEDFGDDSATSSPSW
jgi:hypothetical protein